MDGIKMDRMKDNTAGWPTAAQEHARLLALKINRLNAVLYPGYEYYSSRTRPAMVSEKRLRRLSEALCRLQQRHMPVPKLPKELR